MANGSISNEVHKSVSTGISTSVTVADYTNLSSVIHSTMANIRPRMNTGEMTFFYVNVNNVVIYYGFVNKVSAQIMTGQMFQMHIEAPARILFRDSSADSAATYNVVS